jgi:DNA-binding Lrp family transcriptional regulator
MDEIDRRILYEISENARDSHNILAKKVHCSREVLDYRIKKLKELRILLGSQARINISNFIYAGYILLIQSSGLNLENEKKVIEKISNNKKTQYIGKINGEYDIILGFTIKSLKELSSYLDYVNACFGKNKSKVTLLTMIQEQKDSFKTLFSKKEDFNDFLSMPDIKEKVKIDEIDRQILLELGKDSEIPSWKIADKTKISEVAIRKRIQALIRDKIILGFRAMVDLTKLDYQSYFLFLKTNPKNEKIENDFSDFLKRVSNITYSTKTIGEYSYVITLLVKNNSELKEFIYSLKDKFSDLVTEVHTFPLFEMPYHTQLAKNILE